MHKIVGSINILRYPLQCMFLQEIHLNDAYLLLLITGAVKSVFVPHAAYDLVAI